jgi:hypothetical protein
VALLGVDGAIDTADFDRVALYPCQAFRAGWFVELLI